MTQLTAQSGSAAAQWRRRGLALGFIMWLAVAVYAACAPVFVHASDATLVRIVSGSMSPTYPVGSVLLLDRLGAGQHLHVRDVITFSRGQGLPVTHRVVEVLNLNGTTALRTQGDANRTPDEQLTLPGAVIGKIRGALPTWLNGSLWLQGRVQRVLVFGLPLLVVVHAETRHLLYRRRGLRA